MTQRQPLNIVNIKSQKTQIWNLKEIQKFHILKKPQVQRFCLKEKVFAAIAAERTFTKEQQSNALDVFGMIVACKQAPSWRQAQQKFGAKRRASGACTHLPEYPMSASKFWTQSGDWWILFIHDVILVFSSGRDKNQNGGKERCSSSQSLCGFLTTDNFSARKDKRTPKFHVYHFLFAVDFDFPHALIG